MEIGICDFVEEDSATLSKLVSEFLESAQFELNLDFSITEFKTTRELAKHFNKDLFFINPRKSGKNDGYKIAKQIRAFNTMCYICFVAEDESSAFSGYNVQASGYLIKPVSTTQLNGYLSYVLNGLNKKIETLEVKKNGVLLRLETNKIDYLESQNKKVIFHINFEKVAVAGKLDDFEKKLLHNLSFLRCHKSYLVNMSKIKEIKNYNVIMQDGAIIPIPKMSYNGVKLRFASYKYRDSFSFDA